MAGTGRPDRAGSYELLQEIGRGGFGVVYDARHCESGGPAAVKVLHADLATSEELVRRFHREIDACRRIESSGVVRILEIGTTGEGCPYFAMERLDGEDLAARIDRCGALAEAEAICVLEEVCATVTAAHQAGIIHRDIKASNVFFCAPDKRVVLLDFGVAKLLHSADARLTTSWQILGTPAYRAPEQVGGAADERSDIYALGALLFHMLAGAPPFSGASATIVGYLHRHAQRPRPSTQAAVDPALDAVVMRAMATQPEERFASVAELIDGLRRALLARDHGGELGRHGCTAQRAIAVHLDFDWSGVAHATEPRALAELERVVHAAQRWFREEGFQTVFEASQTLVMARPLSAELESEWKQRASALLEEIEEGTAAGPVRLRATMTSAEALVRAGEIVGGEITQLGSWVPT